MMLKLTALGEFDLRLGWQETKPWISFAYLVTVDNSYHAHTVAPP